MALFIQSVIFIYLRVFLRLLGLFASLLILNCEKNRRLNTVLFALRRVNYLGMSVCPTWSSHQELWEQAAAQTPGPLHTAIPCPSRPHYPSTNAQRSWTTSIWGIILYEIDGWGQPLTERVKTTLRCPLWISMMENRLLKKIYVCSPMPQERAIPHPVEFWQI